MPIDGVGFQSHITLTTDLSSVPGNLRRFADLGLDVAITELDARIPLPADANELATQARQYDSMVWACLSLVRCVSVTVWGFTDSHSWVPGTFPGMGAATLLDEQLRPKPAYTTVQATLAQRDFDGTAVAMHSQRCLDVLDASTANGADVQQFSCHPASAPAQRNQVWRLSGATGHL